MSLHILSIGTSVPEHAFLQHEVAHLAADLTVDDSTDRNTVVAIHRGTGVRQRRSVLWRASSNGAPATQSFYHPATNLLDRGPTTAERMAIYEEAASELACRAAHEALSACELDPQEITHLVTVSCTGFQAPGVDLCLIRSLGLPLDVARTHVGFMGCHGVFNGLRVAMAMVDTNPDAVVLLNSVELCSLHYQYGSRRDRVIANALFADGSSALVGRARPLDGGDRWRLVASGSTLLAGTEELMGWRIGDHGFEMSLSVKVPFVLERRLRRWLTAWLAEQGLTIDHVGSWAVHPGGPRILDACAAALELDSYELQTSRDVLTEYGNMSSSTILFILERLREQKAARPCVAMAFGPGLAVEAALFV